MSLPGLLLVQAGEAASLTHTSKGPTRMNYECTRGSNCTGTLTCQGTHMIPRTRLELPPPNPETIADYMGWVHFRTGSLGRWIKSGGPRVTPIVLETIARLEGDLQQLRHLVKAEHSAELERKIEAATSEVLSHLTRGPKEG